MADATIAKVAGATRRARRSRSECVYLATASIADGLMPVRPGDLTFAHVREWADDVVTVDEQQIAEATLWLHDRGRLVVEPSGEGTHVRFRTMKGNSQAMMLGGLGMFALALVAMVMSVLTGSESFLGALGESGWIALFAAVAFGVGAAQVPGWARIRKQQMEEIGARLLAPPKLPRPQSS